MYSLQFKQWGENESWPVQGLEGFSQMKFHSVPKLCMILYIIWSFLRLVTSFRLSPSWRVHLTTQSTWLSCLPGRRVSYLPFQGPSHQDAQRFVASFRRLNNFFSEHKWGNPANAAIWLALVALVEFADLSHSQRNPSMLSQMLSMLSQK